MDNPNYYAVIPAEVRYDNSLINGQKLLYGELTALSNKNGYCNAGNEYLADLYDVSKRTISSWISGLEKKGYIRTKIIKESDTKQVEERRVYINKTSRKNFPYPIEKNFQPPIEKNFQENNTRYINNIYSRVIEYLNSKTGKTYKHTTKKTQDFIKARINENFKEEDFIKVIDIKTKEWGNDKVMSKYLRPETLFGTKFEGYLNQCIKTENIENGYNSDFSEYDKFN